MEGKIKNTTETSVTEKLTKLSPQVCSYVNDEGTEMRLEINLPGVKRDDIDLNMWKDSLQIKAPREDQRGRYISTLNFCCPVNPDRAEASYNNGLLKLSVPFQDMMDKAKKVKVS